METKKSWVKDLVSYAKGRSVIVDGKTIIRRNGTVVRDNLVNLLGSLSSRRDVTNEYNSFYTALSLLSYTQCENIYLSGGIAKKIVHIPSEYMFRNGVSFRMRNYPDVEKAVIERYKKLNIESKAKQADEDARIYGGAVIIIKDPKQDPLKPFDPTLCGKDPDRIQFIERDLSYLAVQANTEYVDQDYYEPKFVSLAGMQVDISHCVVFKGIKVPKRRIPPMKYFGMSTYQHVLQMMVNDDNISKAIANMVWRNTRWYYFVDGLDELVKDGNKQLALDRFSLAEDNINILSACILDGKDKVQLMNQSFANLDKIDERSAKRLAAASDIPATILMNQSPDGMNATGDSDMEIFYNYIWSEAKKRTPQMNQLFEVLICMETGGKLLPYEFEFNRPNQIDLTKQVDIDAKILDNSSKMQSLGFPDDYIKSYNVKRGLMTSEESESIGELKSELGELENLSPEEMTELNKEE